MKNKQPCKVKTLTNITMSHFNVMLSMGADNVSMISQNVKLDT